jgi:hypothetical protein
MDGMVLLAYVTVMKLSTDVRERPSSEGTECLLLSSSDITEDTNVFRENVLSSSENSDGELGTESLVTGSSVRRLVRDLEFLKLAEDVSDLETFLEVVVLIGIDKLQVFTSVKDNGVVLVIGFTVTENRVTG